MSNYIVCRKKRNNPRMDVRICQAKCESRGECKEFIAYLRVSVQDENARVSLDAHPMGLSPA